MILCISRHEFFFSRAREARKRMRCKREQSPPPLHFWLLLTRSFCSFLALEKKKTQARPFYTSEGCGLCNYNNVLFHRNIWFPKVLFNSTCSSLFFEILFSTSQIIVPSNQLSKQVHCSYPPIYNNDSKHIGQNRAQPGSRLTFVKYTHA